MEDDNPLYYDPESQHNRTIETLMEMQDQDRIALYTAISIAVAYLNDHDMTEVVVDKQKFTINDILLRYEIHSMKILNEKIQQCSDNLKNRGLIRKPPLGDQH